MTKPVPVHLICGFLGSGKTTLLRRILAEQPAEERMVVMVNEFGQLGIDGQLLDGYDTEVRELTSGCICCTLKADFQTSINQMIQDFSPERIVVEATGIAEAGDLVEAVEQVAARSDLSLASVATVVDSENFKHREIFGPLFFNQIRVADLILLNKIDLVEDGEQAELAEALAEVNPRARILPVVYCTVDRETILHPLPDAGDIEAYRAGAPREYLDMLALLTKPPLDDEDHQHDSTQGFVSFSLQQDGIMDRECLNAFLAELPLGVFRVKGFVRFDTGTEVLNYTYHRPEFHPTDPLPENRVAFVAWKTEPDEVLAKLRVCLRDEERD